MKNGFVKSSPVFFRLIIRCGAAGVVLLLLLAILFPAPLQEAANPAVTPNPAKSAWFLLWIQELVSWSRLMMYPVLIIALLFMALPWLPAGVRLPRARWFARENRIVWQAGILLVLLVLLLTIVALFFRGANWQFG